MRAHSALGMLGRYTARWRGLSCRSLPLGRRNALPIRRGRVLNKFDHVLVPSQGIEPQSQDSESCVLPLNELGMDLAPGIEPRLTESKSAVLPLDEARSLVPGSRVERDSMAFQTIATTALAHRGQNRCEVSGVRCQGDRSQNSGTWHLTPLIQDRHSNIDTPCSPTIPAATRGCAAGN